MEVTGIRPRALAGIVVRPRLWCDAAALANDFARRRWWSRAPFLPVPDGEYLRWRLQTAYGTTGLPGGAGESRDLVSLVTFRRELRRCRLR